MLPICLECQSYSMSWQTLQTCPKSQALLGSQNIHFPKQIYAVQAKRKQVSTRMPPPDTLKQCPKHDQPSAVHKDAHTCNCEF